MEYVRANAAKSGKSVSPKVRQKGDRVCAKPENAAGGFFQHSHELIAWTGPQAILVILTGAIPLEF